MSFWTKILLFEKNPKISDLNFEYSVVARDLKRRNIIEDLVQIEPYAFAVVNQRCSVQEKPNDYITTFYWAKEVDAILRAVYGDVTKAVGDCGTPPQELLPVSGRWTYRELVADAEARKIKHANSFVWSPSQISHTPVGLCLSMNRIHYYFVCQPEESAEIKDWNMCCPVAVGFRTHMGRPIE
jgi:hypothetical protein